MLHQIRLHPAPRLDRSLHYVLLLALLPFQPVNSEPGAHVSGDVSILRAELARYKQDLALTRAQLAQAWLGRGAGEEGEMSEEEIDPMQIVSVETAENDAESSGAVI